MKKKLAILLLAIMTVSMVACGKQNDTDINESVNTESSEESKIEIANALEILNTVWGNYADENKFPVGGGDSENLNFEGPAKFDAAKADELNTTLGFPTAQADKIDDAASMMNAMMANNFTAGVYHLKDADDVKTVAEELKKNILARQWMCGMPEKMIVVAVDDYLVSAFGLDALISTFKTEIKEAYDIAEVLYEESIS